MNIVSGINNINMKLKYTLLCIIGFIPFLILGVSSFIARIYDRNYNVGDLNWLGKEIMKNFKLNGKKISFEKTKRWTSGVKVIHENKEYVVLVKKINPRIIIHELTHIENGTSDKSYKLHAFWGFQYNVFTEIFSFWNEIVMWPKISMKIKAFTNS